MIKNFRVKKVYSPYFIDIINKHTNSDSNTFLMLSEWANSLEGYNEEIK